MVVQPGTAITFLLIAIASVQHMRAHNVMHLQPSYENWEAQPQSFLFDTHLVKEDFQSTVFSSHLA